jgi:cysteine desulfurase
MPLKLPIYMDHHATTPVAPEVFEAMRPYFLEHFGNAASRNHAFGWAAEGAVETARAEVARLIGCKPIEVVFTSGATEADNLAVKGVAEAYRDKGRHLITSQIEHPAVLDVCKRLEKDGYQVTYLPVDRHGMVDPPATRSGRSSPSPRSAGSARSEGCSCTATPCRVSGRSRLGWMRRGWTCSR